MPPWREQAPGPPALIEPSLQDTTVRLALNAASALFVELAALAALDLIYAALASAISFEKVATTVVLVATPVPAAPGVPGELETIVGAAVSALTSAPLSLVPAALSVPVPGPPPSAASPFVESEPHAAARANGRNTASRVEYRSRAAGRSMERTSRKGMANA